MKKHGFYDNNSENFETFDFHVALYYVVVTVTTVGYGEITPETDITRIVMSFTIIVFFVVIPIKVSQLVGVIESTPEFRHGLHRTPSGRHIVLCGSMEASAICVFLKELFHDRHYPANADLRVVLLNPDLPSLELRQVLEIPEFETRVMYYRGTAMDEDDLCAIRAYASAAVFVLTRRSPPAYEDRLAILRTMAILKLFSSRKTAEEEAESFRGVGRSAQMPRHTRTPPPVFLQLNRYSRRVEFLKRAGVAKIFCVEKMKMQVLARTCLCPGFSTLLCNLLSSHDRPQTKPLPMDDWQAEYSWGMCNGIHKLEFDETFFDLPFPRAVEDLYRSFGVVLFAVQCAPEDRHSDTPQSPQTTSSPYLNNVVCGVGGGGKVEEMPSPGDSLHSVYSQEKEHPNILLNPGPRYLLRPGDVGFVVGPVGFAAEARRQAAGCGSMYFDFGDNDDAGTTASNEDQLGPSSHPSDSLSDASAGSLSDSSSSSGYSDSDEDGNPQSDRRTLVDLQKHEGDLLAAIAVVKSLGNLLPHEEKEGLPPSYTTEEKSPVHTAQGLARHSPGGWTLDKLQIASPTVDAAGALALVVETIRRLVDVEHCIMRETRLCRKRITRVRDPVKDIRSGNQILLIGQLSSVGVEDFLTSLRKSGSGQPVVMIHPDESLIDELEETVSVSFDEVYYLEGRLPNHNDMARASTLIILSTQENDGGESGLTFPTTRDEVSLQDSTALFTLLHLQVSDPTQVVSAEGHRPVVLVELQHVENTNLMSPGIAEGYVSMPAFAAGRVFTSRMLDTYLLCQAFYYPQLMHITTAMMEPTPHEVCVEDMQATKGRSPKVEASARTIDSPKGVCSAASRRSRNSIGASRGGGKMRNSGVSNGRARPFSSMFGTSRFSTYKADDDADDDTRLSNLVGSTGVLPLDIPTRFHGSPYSDLVMFLVEHGHIPLGLLRWNENFQFPSAGAREAWCASDWSREAVERQSIDEGGRVRRHVSRSRLRVSKDVDDRQRAFVYTNPPADCRIGSRDRVFVLSTQASQN
eukprot:Rmarinus@m.1205